MKNIKIISIAVFVFALGYVAGNFFPFQFSISGDTELRVTILNESKIPVQYLEVDIAEEPGPPPDGGFGETDENGTATFYIKPGRYVVFFSTGNFPKELQYPQPKPILVREDKINEVTIILRTK